MNNNNILQALRKIVKEDDVPDFTPLERKFQEMRSNPKVTEWGPYRVFLPGFDLNLAKWVYENWTPRKDDVLVASFRKTGTTWMRRILSYIFYKDEPNLLGLCKTLTMPHIYLETGFEWKFDFLDNLPLSRRILATHLPAELVNLEKIRNVGTKVIYMIRNPKDQAVSWCHFAPRTSNCSDALSEMYPKDWNNFLRSYMAGEQLLVSKRGEWYPDHILSWHNRHEENVMLVHYEVLKREFKPTIKRVADFLSTKLSDDDLERIERETSFDSMKIQAQHDERKCNMYRRGMVGDWKNHFTVAQSEQMDSLIANKLAGTDINFVYEL
uniref:Sulfotransferase n=1 Tax=Ciona savignyi TaxID=51511 RepID=H2Z3S2_CIOSA